MNKFQMGIVGGNRTGNPKFSAGRGLGRGKNFFQVMGEESEGGKVIKMRKFPDQGCSKLLWEEGLYLRGNFPLRPCMEHSLRDALETNTKWLYQAQCILKSDKCAT